MKRIHCSYHKCLTVYFNRVFSGTYNRTLRWSRGYRHFNSLLDDFYENSSSYTVSSVNNHSLDLDRLGSDTRVTRFIRDPRDLVVSGYFYHRRGAEEWSTIVDPAKEDWGVVNGRVPAGMPDGSSFSSYLKGIDEEQGLIAEIDFREHHFNSMMAWPASDPRVRLFRYEDILGNEIEVFRSIFQFYGLSWLESKVGLVFANRYSANKQAGKTSHIRNHKANQWAELFTPRVQAHFNRKHPGLLERYGYA